MLQRKKYILFVFLCLPLWSIAQNGFLYFSTNKGLASSEIYAVVQDSDGYMWYGTNRGVSRFDGFEFKSFTASDGLPSNSVIEMYYDRFGRIWFSNFDGYLSYYYKGKFYVPSFSDTLKIIAKNYFIREIYVAKDSTIWLAPARGGIYTVSTDGKIKKYNINSRYQCFFLKDFGDGIITAFNDVGLKIEDTLYVENNNGEYYIYGIENAFRKYSYRIRTGEYLFSVGRKIFHLRNNNIISEKTYSSEITNISVDNNKNFWISLMFNGVHIYKSGNLDDEVETFLSGLTPSKMYQDAQGGYWITTTEHGIYYAPSLQFVTYSRYDYPQLNIMSVASNDDVLYIGTYSRQVYKLGFSGLKISSFTNLMLPKANNSQVKDMVFTTDGSLWLLGNDLLRLKNDSIVVVDSFSHSYKLFAKDTNVYAVTKKGINIYSKNNFRQIEYPDLPAPSALYVDENNTVWIGTINGLYIYKDKKFVFLGEKNPKLKYRINDISKIDKWIILATNGNGIILYNVQNEKVFPITEKFHNLASDFINCVTVNKGDVWAGTNNGLSKINIIETSDSVMFFVTNFSTGDGLYANEIKDITFNDDYFFLGTSEGLVSFNSKKIKKNTSEPILHIDSVKINDKKVENDTVYKFYSGKNSINIFYKAICFYAENKMIYKYKLDNYDEKWLLTKDRFLRFTQLPPGHYTLYITASADGNAWSKDYIKINFIVKKRFRQTLFFYILIAFIMFIAAVVYLNIRFSNLQKEIRLNRKMLHLEQKALRAQMNPHFIFNALNSIRRYVLVNDTDNADNYLTNFADLMRKVLENSKKEIIPLSEEIETLKIYMELERMRFDESFTFNIEIDRELNLTNFYVPPMIIQPAIENAIWHGLATLGKNGVLSLSFKKNSESSFTCDVVDNGIGREKSMQISKQRKGHKSTGIKNLNERIKAINEIGIMKIDYKTIDLYDAEENPKGTKVEILFKKLKITDKKKFIKILGKKIYFNFKLQKKKKN